MRISLQRMLSKLEAFSPAAFCGEGSIFQFRTIRFWDGTVEAGVLYIAEASRLPREIPEADERLQIMCVLDEQLPVCYMDGAVRLVAFPAGTSGEAIYNCLSTHFSDLFEGSTSLQKLIGHLVRGSFDEILASISSIMRRSVVLFSANLRAISNSAYGNDRPPQWDAIQKLGYYPGLYRLPPELSTGNVLVRDRQKRFRIFSEDLTEGGEIFAPIIADNLTREILGYIYFYEPNHDAIADNSESIAFICHTLSWRMWKFTHTPERSHAILTDTLYSVLDGTMADDQVITAAMTRAGLHQRGYRLLAVISSGSGGAVDALVPTEKWSDLFKETWNSKISFLYNGDLILILQAESPEDLMRKALPGLLERISLMGCFAGISDVFTEIDHYFLNHYTRALAAMQVAALHGESACVSYDAVALEHIIHFGRIAASRAVVDPRLLQLMKSDQEFSTDYLETLRWFWACDKDVSKTCETLHIHRSTLFYRLKKIKFFLGEDFQSHNRQLQLCISITILEKLGEIPRLH